MSKFNEEITKEIIKLYNNGIPLKHCASAVGIDRRTLHRWIDKGKNAKTGKYREFYIEIQKARAKFIAYHQKKINDSKDWRSSQYLLQVTDPEHYVLQDKLKVESESKVTVESKFDKELFERILNEEE